MRGQQLVAYTIMIASLSVLLGAILQRTLVSEPVKKYRGAKGCHAVVDLECSPRKHQRTVQKFDGEVVRFN